MSWSSDPSQVETAQLIKSAIRDVDEALARCRHQIAWLVGVKSTLTELSIRFQDDSGAAA